MKMVGIVGSLRKDSIHRQVFNHYREIASDTFDMEEGVIAGIPLFDGEDMDNPVALKLADQIRSADGVIFFAPDTE